MLKKTACLAALCAALFVPQVAFAQDTEWPSGEANSETSSAVRIVAETGIALVGGGVSLAAGVIFGYTYTSTQSEDHYYIYTDVETQTPMAKRITYKHWDTLHTGMFIAGFMAPFVESALVYFVGSNLDSQGIGWTPFAGGVAGGAIGGALGAIGFVDSRDMGATTFFLGAAVGAIIGAITWYEISDKQQREKSIVSNIRPILNVSQEYTSLGVGFDF